MFLWNEVENIPYLLRAKAAMPQENVVMASHYESLDRSVRLSDWLRVKWAAFASSLVMCSGALKSVSSDRKGNELISAMVSTLVKSKNMALHFFRLLFQGKTWNQRKLGKACVRGTGLSLQEV